MAQADSLPCAMALQSLGAPTSQVPSSFSQHVAASTAGLPSAAALAGAAAQAHQLGASAASTAQQQGAAAMIALPAAQKQLAAAASAAAAAAGARGTAAFPAALAPGAVQQHLASTAAAAAAVGQAGAAALPSSAAVQQHLGAAGAAVQHGAAAVPALGAVAAHPSAAHAAAAQARAKPDDNSGQTCELAGVLKSVLATLLSIIGASIAMFHKGDVESCLVGLGQAAGPLQGLMGSLGANYTLIVLVNLVSTAAIWLSFFHCDCLEYHWKHVLTSARSLFWLLCLTYATFCFQLARLGYALTMHGVLATLAYICNLGPGVVYLAQELVYAMGNATSVGGAQSAYSPYGDRPYGEHFATSEYFSMNALVTKFDILTYCKDTDGGKDAGASAVMLGCFLTIISQALMGAALSGEEARVGVHDMHEEHKLTELSKQFGSLGEWGNQGLSGLEHRFSGLSHSPTLGKVEDRAQAAWHSASGFANNLLSGWQHHPSAAGYTAGNLVPAGVSGSHPAASSPFAGAGGQQGAGGPLDHIAHGARKL